MSKTWTFYDLATGALRASTFTTADDSMLEHNTPPHCGAVEGVYDSESQRVDLETGTVVDWQPPQPSADHEWVETTVRWELNEAARQARSRDYVARQNLAELELKSGPRAVREALLAVLPEGRPERTRLLELDAEAVQHRKNILKVTG